MEIQGKEGTLEDKRILLHSVLKTETQEEHTDFTARPSKRQQLPGVLVT